MYHVKFYDDVFYDLDKLPDDIATEAKEYFYKYEKDPYKYSQKLYNQGEFNLEGYRKTYLADASYRIVLKIENNIAKIVEVVAVGKRENMEVYKEAFNRIK